MTEDAELLRLYAENRSEAAFAELVQRHLSLVYSTALRQLNGDAHAAQDVAQTVFTSLARKASSLTTHRTLAGWLYLGAHHAATQAVRGERRRHAREQEAHLMQEISSNSEFATDWDRVRPVLDEVMTQLGATDREAVLLRYFERRPYADIGATLRLSEDAARMRVDRALEKLRVLLARRGIASATAALVAALGDQAMVAAPTGLAATVTGTALAGIGAATGITTLTMGIFMTKPFVSLSLASLAFASVGTTFYFAHQARQSASAAANSNQELAAMRAKAAEVEQRAARAEQESTLVKRERAEAGAKKTTPTSISPGAGVVPSPALSLGATGWTALPAANEAEARSRMRELSALGIETDYSALFRQLKFTPEQIEQFRNLKLDLMEKTEEEFRARTATARSQNPAVSRMEIQKIFGDLNLEQQTAFQKGLSQIFGDELAPAFQRFESTRVVRPLASQLASALFYTDSPLATEQAEQLVDLMSRHARDAQGQVDLNALNGLSVLEESRKMLSPSQHATFVRILSQQVRKQLDQERLRDESSKPAPRSP